MSKLRIITSYSVLLFLAGLAPTQAGAQNPHVLSDVIPPELAQLTDEQMDGFRGAGISREAILNLIANMRAATGDQNTASVTVDGNPTDTSSGPGDQTASFTGRRTTASASAGSGTGMAPPPRTRMSTRSRMTVRSVGVSRTHRIRF